MQYWVPSSDSLKTIHILAYLSLATHMKVCWPTSGPIVSETSKDTPAQSLKVCTNFSELFLSSGCETQSILSNPTWRTVLFLVSDLVEDINSSPIHTGFWVRL